VSDNYIYQKFLTITDTSDVRLEDYGISENEMLFLQDCTVTRNLFDDEKELTRKINLSVLDENIDTEEDFNLFLATIEEVKTLYIFDDRPNNQNPIYKEYSDEILKAFIVWFEKHGITCKVVENLRK